MKSLVIGAGEVGKAIFDTIKDFHESYIKDVEDLDLEGVEVLHICYPDSNRFISDTYSYISKYKPKVTIIHSSIAIGTSQLLQCVYSPVRGRHPNLAPEIKVYKKFMGSKNTQELNLARKYFKECGIKTSLVNESKSLEFLKLISNIHMGLEIAWRQELEEMMKEMDINPKVYTRWEKSYQTGYRKLKQYNLIRSIMRPDPIGGHCILPCTEIANKQFVSKAFEFILERNQKTLDKSK